MRTRHILPVLMLTLLLATPAADAAVEIGTDAPDITGGDFFNTEPVKLSDLKGRLILLELFSTTWGPCRAQVGHLNKLQEEFDGKGLTILSVTGEDAEKVAPFVEELEAEYPILVKANSGPYSTGGVPQAYLIGADGTVKWQGHPGTLQDDEITGHLKDVEKTDRVSTWSFTLAKQLPPFPDKLSSAHKDLEKHEFGKALKKVESGLGRLEGDDKSNGETIRDWIKARGDRVSEQAATLVREGRIYEAFLLYEKLEGDFKGHDLGSSAKKAAKELEKNKDYKLEIKAGEKLAKIKVEMRDERKPEDKLACLKPLLSRKYEETRAGKEAAAMAKELEGQVEKK